MSSPVVIPTIVQANSTSYADVAGIPAGITRLSGEPTDKFLDRLERAFVESRDRSYEGILNNIALRLGLSVNPGIQISGPADTTVTCDFNGLALVSSSGKLTCPLVSIDQDGAWTWNSLSSITAQINASTTWQAQLLGNDGPAVQLARQTNAGVGMPYECVISEVGLIGLTEPSFPAIAATPAGAIVYQLQEIVQAIMQRDASYWAR